MVTRRRAAHSVRNRVRRESPTKATHWGAAEPYAVFLDDLRRQLANNDEHAPKAYPSIALKLPGLFQLLSSMSAGAPTDYRTANPIEEWNPFAQRLPYLTASHIQSQTLTGELEIQAHAVSQFILIAHEAMHIFLLEPFFSRRQKHMSARQFLELSLSIEAFCFWYADIVVTRSLRVRLADGEIVRSRNANSSVHFHPYRAFVALGITDQIKILEVYIDAMCGYESALFHGRDQLFVRDLYRRLTGFYVDVLKPTKLLKTQLDGIGVFDEFRTRFASMRGLPSLVPDEVAKLVTDPQAYCHAIATLALPQLQKMPVESVLRVRERRHIQARAYAAYSLLHTLDQKTFFSANGKSISVRALKSAVAVYLDRLEEILGAVANGGALTAIREQCASNDQRYSREVRDVLRDGEAWATQRPVLFPLLATKNGALGFLRSEDRMTKKQIHALVSHLIAMGTRVVITNPTSPVATPLARLIEQSSHSDLHRNTRRLIEWKRTVNAFLREPTILPLWSVRLDAIDPENNSFRELHFTFT